MSRDVGMMVSHGCELYVPTSKKWKDSPLIKAHVQLVEFLATNQEFDHN